MLVRYEKGAFEPISFVEFARAPISFISHPLVLYEPFFGAPAPTVPFRDERLSSTELSRVLHQSCKINPVFMKRFRLWQMLTATVSLAAQKEMQEAMRNFDWFDLASSSAVDPSDLFFDLKPDFTLLSVLRPPQAAIRGSSPVKLVSPPVSLLARRSQQTSSLQTTFVSSQAPDFPALAGNEHDLIVDHIYIGSENAARNGALLSAIGVTHVVHLVASDAKGGFPAGFQHCFVRVNDSPFEELRPDFWESLKFVTEALEAGGTVFVHCRRGICRSAVFCVAYLIEARNLPFDAALTLVKQKRPVCEINQGFADQLRAREAAQKPKVTGRGRLPLLVLSRPL
jgi:dual specificity phosphatase 12